MTAIKIQEFQGEFPVAAPELLPESAAAKTLGPALFDGDIQPYRESVVAVESDELNFVTAIHRFKDRGHYDARFVSWINDGPIEDTDVDVVEYSISGDDENPRVFWSTRNGEPRWATRRDFDELAGITVPNDFGNRMGLPPPEATLSVTPNRITTKAAGTPSRTNDIATINIGVHQFEVGHLVEVTGYEGDDALYNTAAAKVTAVAASAIQYRNEGPNGDGSATGSSVVRLAGTNVPRTYLFTYVSAYGDESVPSLLSETIDMKDQETATITFNNFPARANLPDGVDGVRIYRSILSAEGSDFFRVRTLWLNKQVLSATAKTGGAEVAVATPHNLNVGDQLWASGSLGTTLTVTEILSPQRFCVDQVPGSGDIIYNTAPSRDDDFLGWGYGGSFHDVYDSGVLFQTLLSGNNIQPPKGLHGLAQLPNGTLLGFEGSTLYFSKLRQLQAWPAEFARKYDERIIAVKPVAGYIVVLTTGRPIVVAGTSPSTFRDSRVDSNYPCLSKRSVVVYNNSVQYVTQQGIAAFSPSGGVQLATEGMESWFSWQDYISIEELCNLQAVAWNGMYVGSCAGRTFTFKNSFVRLKITPVAMYSEYETGILYFLRRSVRGRKAAIMRFHTPGESDQTVEWESKEFVVGKPTNMGALFVDWEPTDEYKERFSSILEDENRKRENAIALLLAWHGGFNNQRVGGVDLNGMPNYAYTPPPVEGVALDFERPICDVTIKYIGRFHGDLIKNNFGLADVSKDVRVSGVPSRRKVRLPRGFRSDKFKIAISTNARVKSIMVATTPQELEQS